MSIPSTPIDKLLAELGAPDYASIEIWRPTAQGSAVHAVATENVERYETDPAYGARFVGDGRREGDQAADARLTYRHRGNPACLAARLLDPQSRAPRKPERRAAVTFFHEFGHVLHRRRGVACLTVSGLVARGWRG